MQLDVLRQMCGPEVEVLTNPRSGSVQSKGKDVLVLRVDGAERPVTLTGPVGSLEQVLRALAQDQGLEGGKAGRYAMGGDLGGVVLNGVHLFLGSE